MTDVPLSTEERSRRVMYVLATIAILTVAAVWTLVFTHEMKCERAKNEYFKWGYYAALTSAPEARERMRKYRDMWEKCGE